MQWIYNYQSRYYQYFCYIFEITQIVLTRSSYAGHYEKQMVRDGGMTKPCLPRVTALPLMTSFFKFNPGSYCDVTTKQQWASGDCRGVVPKIIPLVASWASKCDILRNLRGTVGSILMRGSPSFLIDHVLQGRGIATLSLVSRVLWGELTNVSWETLGIGFRRNQCEVNLFLRTGR